MGGWTAVNKLRRMGIPITDTVMDKVFPETSKVSRDVRPADDIKRVAPEPGQTREFLAVLRELEERTRRTAAIESLPEMGKKLLGLDVGVSYSQVTLVRNDRQPNESYTALVPEPLARSLRRNVIVAAKIAAQGQGDQACWVVSHIEIV